MPGPGAFWVGEEEKQAIAEVLESQYLFRFGDVNNPKFLQKTAAPASASLRRIALISSMVCVEEPILPLVATQKKTFAPILA